MKNKIYLYIFIPFAISLIAVFFPSLTILSPIPMVLGLPLLVVADLGFFTMLLILIVLNFVVFFILNRDLIKGRGYEKIPKRSSIVMLILIVLNILYFIGSWGNAMDFQGFLHTAILILVNLLFVSAFWIILLTSRKHPSYAKALALNLIIQIWLFWYAFPWLGEGI